VEVEVFEHRIGLVLKLFSNQPHIDILLVTEVDSVVSFIHLECAPFGCIGYLQYPIVTITMHIPGLCESSHYKIKLV
jgi:hypothetical protein